MKDKSRLLAHLRWWLLASVLVTIRAALAQDSRAIPSGAPGSDRTELPGESFPELGKSVIRDQKQIWMSPFRVTRQNAKWWMIFGTATGVLIELDRRLARQLPNTPDQLSVSHGVSRLGEVYSLAPIAGGIYLSGVLTRQPKLRETGFMGAEALVDALIVSEVLKVATGRNRPLEGDGRGHFFHGSDGFPSGHTIESIALASVIAHRYPDKKVVVILSYGVAGLIGASRFTGRKHFASDVVAGGAMGWFIGRHVSERRASGGRAWLTPRVVPQVQPAAHSYGVLLAWQP